MIRFYDKTDGKYFELQYMHDDFLTNIKNNINIVFVDDNETLIFEINKIPKSLTRFIVVLGGTVQVNKEALINDLMLQLAPIRSDAFSKLDGEFFKLSEKINLETNSEKLFALKTELKKLIDKKEKLRNIKDSIPDSICSTAYYETIEYMRNAILSENTDHVLTTIDQTIAYPG